MIDGRRMYSEYVGWGQGGLDMMIAMGEKSKGIRHFHHPLTNPANMIDSAD